MTRPRTALITTVRRQHDALLDQVSGFSLGAEVPDLHVVVALADRTVSQGQLPITSDRWETVIAALPTVRQQLPTARGLELGIERAVQEGAELLILLDPACIPGPRFVELLHEHLASVPGTGRPTVWAPAVQRLRPPPPEGYEFTKLKEWVVGAQPGVPALPPEWVDAPLDPDQFTSPCLAISAADLESVGGLCPEYVGGVGHDTDLAVAVAQAGGEVRLVAGPVAYRQPEADQHSDGESVEDVERVHLAAMTTNAGVFRQRWNRWPVASWWTGPLRAGLVTEDADDTDS